MDFESDNDEKYNVDFSKRELIKSIAQAIDSAGPDDIHYQFLKHLPDVSLDLLLLLLNNLWQSQDFPDGWREATVIPVPKPRKDRVSALILLDFSAVFDTIDHATLTNRILDCYGISGQAQFRFSSYLQNRHQSLKIKDKNLK